MGHAQRFYDAVGARGRGLIVVGGALHENQIFSDMVCEAASMGILSMVDYNGIVTMKNGGKLMIRKVPLDLLRAETVIKWDWRKFRFTAETELIDEQFEYFFDRYCGQEFTYVCDTIGLSKNAEGYLRTRLRSKNDVRPVFERIENEVGH